MRKTYKFSHKVVQGGYVYSHKSNSKIKNKEGLRNVLRAIASKYKLIDVTIKVYDSIFFFFFMMRNVEPNKLIKSIHKNILGFGDWVKDYLYGTVYDLQEGYLRKDLEKWGFDYDKG